MNRFHRWPLLASLLAAVTLPVVPVSGAGQRAPLTVLNDPNRFPIAVWLQSPANAARYKAAGINLYVGLWQGPTESQLGEVKKAGMPVICEQNVVGLAHRNDATIAAWMHGDEPDNAQPVKDPLTGKTGYGPCIPPARIVNDYQKLKAADPSRPVLLNLGQGVANDEWMGRGNGAKLTDYETYVQGGDIVSFDVYPVAGLGDPGKLWYVAKGIDRLQKWTGGKRRVWSCIECTPIDGKLRATPAQVMAEVWMAIVHGARGIIYFVHQFQPRFNEHALLDDPEMLPAVTALNREVQSLAAVINSTDGLLPASVRSSTDTPIAFMRRDHGGFTYIFAVGMRNAATRGVFQVDGLARKATAEVMGENRTVMLSGGQFQDNFAPYAVHLYRIKR